MEKKTVRLWVELELPEELYEETDPAAMAEMLQNYISTIYLPDEGCKVINWGHSLQRKLTYNVLLEDGSLLSDMGEVMVYHSKKEANKKARNFGGKAIRA